METQVHRKANQSEKGNEGHGGVHVCHKCGWPFPNPHPSAKHRRAHKRVCGTLEGYKLDSYPDKTHLNGSDDDHISDDDHKTPPSGKVLERTISRRSSSGVGSRSSRSTRSEDEVFADAATDFVDSLGIEDASDDVIERGNSLHKITEKDPDGAELIDENTISDKLCAPGIDDNQQQTVETLEVENEKREADMLPQNRITSSTMNPAPSSASMTIENENAVQQNMMQSSITSSELAVSAEDGKEIPSSKDLSELTTYSETATKALEDASVSFVTDELLDSISAGGTVNSTGMETYGFEEKVELSPKVDSPGNFDALMHSVQVTDAANGNTSNSSDLMECDSKIEANAGVYVLSVPNDLPVQEHPEIPVEDLDHKGGKFNISMAMDSPLAVGSLEFGKTPAVEESPSSTDFSKPGESDIIFSEDNITENVHSKEDMLKQDSEESKPMVEQHLVGERNQAFDVEVSNADISEFRTEELEDLKSETMEDQKVSCTQEQKAIVSSENLCPEGAATFDGGDCQESRSNGVANTSDDVKNDVESCVVHESDDSKVPVEELAVTSSISAEPAVDDAASQGWELINTHDRNDTCDDKRFGVEGVVLNGNEKRVGREEDDGINERFEPEKSYDDHSELDEILDPGNVVAGHSEPDTLLTRQGGREIQSVAEYMERGEHIDKKSGDAVMKTDSQSVSVSKMAESGVLEASLPSSAAVEDSSTKEFAENVCGVVEGDVATKQHVAVSAVDAPVDSGSQTDSLEGNWGSVSVLSAISDAQPALSDSPESAEPKNINMEPRSMEDSRLSEGKPSVEPQVGVEEKEGATEIQTSPDHQHHSSATQTGPYPSVAHLANEPRAGNKNEEIIAKVTNWSTEKQHTPLKTLLVEATDKSRAESPNHYEDDEIPVMNNGSSAKTDKVEAAKEEIGKEWNSPARYPVNIKTEKRRAKSRGYWAPFLCCSSVNAR